MVGHTGGDDDGNDEFQHSGKASGRTAQEGIGNSAPHRGPPDSWQCADPGGSVPNRGRSGSGPIARAGISTRPIKYSVDPEKLKALFDAWDQADEVICSAQGLCNKAIIPSINELRYAGTHLTRAIRALDQKEFSEEVDSAVNHCNRAVFDAAEAKLNFFVDKFYLFQCDYREIPIGPVFPEYRSIQLEVSRARDILASRAVLKEDRWKKADEANACSKTLYGFMNKLDCARDDLNKILFDREDDRKRND